MRPADLIDFGRAGDIFDRAVEKLICSNQRATALESFVAVVEFDTGFDVIEKRRCDRHVPERAEAIGDRAHMRVDAENFLNDDDSAPGRACRLGQIGADALHAGGV